MSETETKTPREKRDGKNTPRPPAAEAAEAAEAADPGSGSCPATAGPGESDADAVVRPDAAPPASPAERGMPIPPAPADLIAALAATPRLLVTAHVRPDGDAAGSAVGLVRIMRRLGREAWCVGLDPLPEPLAFLTRPEAGEEPLVLPPQAAAQPPGTRLAVLDCASPDRLPALSRAYAEALPRYVIDHHASNDGFGEMAWIAPSASSTGEMIATLAYQAGWTIPPAAADALWVALLTDTGRFAHSNTSPSALMMGAYLVACGADPMRMSDRIYQSAPLLSLRLAGRVIDSVRVGAEGRVAWAGLSRRDFAEIGAGPEQARDMVDYPRSLAGVEIALFFCELGQDAAKGQVKVSLRTRPPHDSLPLARVFGGGGHVRAAGFSLPGVGLEEAKRRVLKEIKRIYGLQATP